MGLRKIVILLPILIVFGYIYYQHFTQESRFWTRLDKGTRIRISGRLFDQPYQSGYYYYIELQGIRVKVELSQPLFQGSLLEITGNLERRVIDGSFSHFWLTDPEIKVVEDASEMSVFSFWYWYYRISLLQMKLGQLAYRTFSQTHAALLEGIVLGLRSRLPRDFYEALVATGTIHIVAASGFNVSVVAQAILRISGRFMRRRLALVVALGGVLFYSLLSGASVPVLRAAIMGSLVILGQVFGREAQPLWLLIIAAAALFLIDPWTIHDVSFQLSVLSTAGILLFSSKFQGLFEWLFLQRLFKNIFSQPDGVKTVSFGYFSPARVLRALVEFISVDFSTTLAATLATFPVILITFGRVSTVSLVVNLLVLWMVPPIMFLGLIFFICSLIVYPLAQLIGWLLWPLLQLFILVVSWWASLPAASVEVTPPSAWFVFGYYGLLLAFWLVLSRSGRADALS